MPRSVTPDFWILRGRNEAHQVDVAGGALLFVAAASWNLLGQGSAGK